MSDLLSIGLDSILAHQAAISVTGNNIANENVEGYTRLTPEFTQSQTVETAYGYVGTGADVTEISRNFDRYLEGMYLSQKSQSTGSQVLYDQLALVESRFIANEDYGLSALLDDYWQAWETLSATPDDAAARSALLTTSETLAGYLNDSYQGLEDQQAAIDEMIGQEVDEINSVCAQLADLNGQIVANPGNNSLLDERDSLLRDLSGKVDTNVLYNGSGQVTVMTTSGQTLVTGEAAYELSFEGPQSSISLEPDSDFDGAAYFSGSSDHEITLQAVSAGDCSGTGTAAVFRASLDGGKTWLTDEDGLILQFSAGGEGQPMNVAGVDIWFGESGDPSTAPSTDFQQGDLVSVVPKSGVYWHQTSSSKENISPLYSDNGRNLDGRLEGGTLSGLLQARDRYMGEYKDELDALSEALVWETNFIHSQGAGLDHFSILSGDYRAEDTSSAMAESGLDFADRLQSGGLSLALYDSDTGAALGVTAVDFASIIPPGTANFDPDQHSLEDLAQAVNASFPGQITASVSGGALTLEADPSVQFEIADDSAGLMAALGMNTYFSGSSASSIAVSEAVASNPDRVATGHVNGQGEVNSGDNETAKSLANLANKEVSIISDKTTTTRTMNEYLAAIVSGIGSDSASAQQDYEYAEALSYELLTRSQEVSGVNLDEELALLTRYQQGYEAASRLIQASTEMFDTIIALGA